jgi:hypothetical protein
MRVRARTVCLFVLGWLGGATSAPGQVPRATADSVGRALGALTARFDSVEAGTCPSGPAIVPPGRSGEPRTDSLIAGLETLTRRLEKIRAALCGPAAPAPAAVDTSDDLAALRAPSGPIPCPWPERHDDAPHRARWPAAGRVGAQSRDQRREARDDFQGARYSIPA